MSRKSTILLIVIGVVVLIVVAAMSIDYGTGLVRDKVAEAVRDSLDSQVARGSVSGNPFKGYRLSDIAIVADGEEVLVAEEISAKVSVISLLTGGPPVSMLEISGFHSDVDKINRLISRIKPGEGEGELPIKKLRIVDSTFQSEWANVNIRDVRLVFAGEEIQTDLDLVADELPVKGELDLTRAGDAWSIVRMDVDIGQGKLTAKGELVPELSVKGALKELEVSSIVDFWPEADPSLYKGDFSTEFAAEGTWLDPDISGNFDFTGEMLAGIPVEQATARWRFRSNRLDVADLDMRFFGFPLAGSLAFVFDPGTPPRMLVKLQGSAADLEALAKVSEKLEGVSGTLDKFAVDLQGPVASPEGRVDFEAGKLGYKGYTVSDTVLDARIKGGNVTISGKSVFEGAPVTVGGNVSNFMTDPAVNVSGTLRSLSLEAARDLVPALKEMKASGRVNANYKVSGRSPDFVISGKTWSDKLSVMDYVFSKVSSFFDYNVKADTLRFSDLKAGWKEANITGSGKISKLSSENRSGDIAIRAGNLDSAFFAEYYPPVAEYDLKGTMAIEAKIKGALSKPTVDVSLTSPSLSVKNAYRFTNLKAGTSLESIPAGMPSDIRLDMSADTATAAGMVLRNVEVGLRKKDKVVTISEGKAVLGGGNVSATGTVTLAEPVEKTTLDLVVSASKVNLGKVSIGSGKGLPASGVITAEANVSGTVENPQIAVNASAPFVAASGVKVDGVKVKLAGDMNKLTIEEMSGKVGEGSIAVTGDVKPAPFAAEVSVNGQNLDLKPMTSRFEMLDAYDIKGSMDLVFNGHIEKGKNNGKGKATSASVRFMGMNFTDISLPFELIDERLVSSNGTATFYGGKVSNKGALNLNNMSFTDDAEVKGTDVNALLKDAYKLKGNITGKADIFAEVSGAFGKNGLRYSGKGLLKMGRGAVTGFKLVDIATAVYGSKGINFASIYVPFNLETGRVILNKDTLAEAPEGDPIYKYFSATGPVGPGNKLNLNCSGKVNVKVINAVLGGAAGGASGLTATQNLIGILEGALKGAETGMKEDDFRNVSFALKGTFDKPGISNVKVSAPEKQEQTTEPAEEKTKEIEVEETAPKTPEETVEQKKEDIEEKIKEEIFRKIFD